MICISQEDLKVTGALEIESISNLYIEATVNNHANAMISATIPYSKYKEFVHANTKKAVTIWAKNKVLFNGIIESLLCNIEGQYAAITVKMLSVSILLDRKKKKCSFQDTTLKISDIINIAAQNGQVIFNATDSSIKMPIIQYQETDWEFIRRLTSRVGSVVYPDIKQDFPGLYIGMQEGTMINISTNNFYYGLCEDYYTAKSKGALGNKEDYIFYEVKSYEDYDLGSTVHLNHIMLKIYDKKVHLEKSEVIFTYRLSTENMVSLARYENEMFAGMTILGKVLSTKNETLRLHLEIDKEQVKEKAYDYEWTPETGNTMYCMPKIGTKVCLYFMNETEESALATSCIRENATSCSQMSNVNDRYLTTENNKQLYLKPDCIGMISEETGMVFSIEDNSGISVGSSKEVMIAAKNAVKFKGKQIRFSTPSEIKLLQG